MKLKYQGWGANPPKPIDKWDFYYVMALMLYVKCNQETRSLIPKLQWITINTFIHSLFLYDEVPV